MTAKRIRPARADDAPGVAAIYAASVTNSVVSFEMRAPTPEEMAGRIHAIQERTPWLVCESDGGICGYTYASRHRERAAYQWSLDSSVFVDGGYRRQGIGRALYTALFDLVKRQGYHAVHAGITLPNAASVGLHESLGFRSVAVYPAVGYKLGAWRDVGWWQLELRERRGPPGPVRSTKELEAAEPGAWTAALDAGERQLR